MVEESYKKALRDAREELLRLLPEQERIDNRVAQLKKTVLSLSALCGEEAGLDTTGGVVAAVQQHYMDIVGRMIGKPGLTDATRAVLKAFNRPMTATEVKDGLTIVGYDLSGQSNVLASLAAVLKRLVDSKEVEPVNKDGRAAYQWKTSAVLSSESALTKFAEDLVTTDKGERVYKNPPYTRESASGIRPRRIPKYNPDAGLDLTPKKK